MVEHRNLESWNSTLQCEDQKLNQVVLWYFNSSQLPVVRTYGTGVSAGGELHSAMAVDIYM